VHRHGGGKVDAHIDRLDDDNRLSLPCNPPMRQQLPDPAVGMRGQPCQHVLQVVAGFRPADLGVARWDAEAREE